MMQELNKNVNLKIDLYKQQQHVDVRKISQLMQQKQQLAQLLAKKYN